ncbi:MAG: hypothetical protein ACOZNI_22465 [Myxococcota bacterium]
MLETLVVDVVAEVDDLDVPPRIIPERDYAKCATLDGLLAYLGSAVPAK